MAGKTTIKKSKVTKKKATSRPSTQFSVMAPDAKEVFLVGEFNDWDCNAFRMRRFKDGNCKKSVKLKPGRYEYLFLVDGEWRTDPSNDQRCRNPFGSENSFIVIE